MRIPIPLFDSNYEIIPSTLPFGFKLDVTKKKDFLIINGSPNLPPEEFDGALKEIKFNVNFYFDFFNDIEEKFQTEKMPKIVNTAELEELKNLSKKSISCSGVLTVFQNPMNLWEEKECEFDEYPKENKDFKDLSSSLFRIYGVSVRGRQHAQKALARDDDFSIDIDEKSGWAFLAVADGAGSAKYSRKGSEIACVTATQSLKDYIANNKSLPNTVRSKATSLIQEENNQQEGATGKSQRSMEMQATLPENNPPLDSMKSDSDPKTIDDLLKDYIAIQNNGGEEIANSLKEELMGRVSATMTYSAFDAYLEIKAEADKKNRHISQYATTLLIAAIKKIEDKWVFFTFWVGDGAFYLYPTTEKELYPSGAPDEGEYSGETRFLTMRSIFSNNLRDRIRARIINDDDFTALFLMTDGIADPKFPTKNEDEENKNRDRLWNEISSAITSENQKQSLLDWIQFYSKGEHDDRTLVVLTKNRGEN